MFLLVAGRAQSRGRSDEPIRTQRDRSRSRDRPITNRRSKRRSEKESDSSNSYPPIIVGPLTTNQDLSDAKGERVYNLPLMIQQPFLREKKEPIKVDISVKLIPKPRKKDKKKRGAQVEEIIIQSDENKGVKNSISMEVNDGSVHVLKETVEMFEDESKPNSTEPIKEATIEAEQQEDKEITNETILTQSVNNKNVEELRREMEPIEKDGPVLEETEINKEETTVRETNETEACEDPSIENREITNTEEVQIIPSDEINAQQEVTADDTEITEQQIEQNDQVETT